MLPGPLNLAFYGQNREGADMALIVLDRFEGDFAVLEEDGRMFSVPRSALAGAKEGDLLTPDGDGGYVPDPEGTAERQRKMRSRFDRLKKKKG